MNSIKMIAVALIVAGVLALVHGDSRYQRHHRRSLGSLERSVKENKSVNIPVRAGVAAVVHSGWLCAHSRGWLEVRIWFVFECQLASSPVIEVRRRLNI